MKKVILIFLIIISVLTIVSCGEAEAPEGMQLVYGSEEDGYYFYSPEGWNISNLEGIKAAYVSKVNTTSVSFTEVTFNQPDGISEEEYFFTSYFTENFKEFPEGTKITVNGEESTFGVEGAKADRAKKYVYTYEYQGHTFGFIQTLMTKHGRFYICTYRSTFDKYNNEDTTYYEKYLEKYLMVENNFKFTEKLKAPTEENPKEYKKDSDGYILISDSELSGFDLYVPEDFKVNYSSAAVKATSSDGSNIMMTETAPANLYIDQYWKARKDELQKIVKNLTVISEIPTERVAKDEEGYEEYRNKLLESVVTLGNAISAYACEYTYEYNGSTYHVFQVFAIDSEFMGSGYALTFTAKEENYAKYIDVIEKILSKVEF